MGFDKAFGIHAQALQLRAKRAELLASNLANADTPNYKARDVDFQALLNGASPNGAKLKISQPGHMQPGGGGSVSNEQLQYRIPNQPSLDGNTVDTQIERSEFMQNSVMYRASLRFLNGKISGLITAIRGE